MCSLAMTGARLALLAACASACDVERALDGPPGARDNDAGLPDGFENEQWHYFTAPNKIDLLFMIDNSNGMAAMQEELKARFNEVMKTFLDLSYKGLFADLHIGVVTSDYGAGATGAPGCQPSPGGQQGKLQPIGGGAAAGCKPPNGSNFIAYKFANNGADNNLPTGQDLIATFACMASVGDAGCGFQHQLESVYAALQNNLPENADFLRDDALLTVAFLTDEDDGSAPPDSDLFDRTKTAQYGLEDSFRDTRFGIVCGAGAGTPPPYGDSGGPLTNCRPAPPGKLYDVQRYIDFFTRPAPLGGIKFDPRDVILIAIDAPEKPVQVILSDPGTPIGSPYVRCGALDQASNPPCVPVLQHSCQNLQQPDFFGDPAVRLNAVVNAVENHGMASICDSDYTGSLQALGYLIGTSVTTYCLPDRVADPSAPDCVVQALPTDGAQPIIDIPSCGGGDLPCWRVTPLPACAATSPQGIGVVVDKPLANTETRFVCR